MVINSVPAETLESAFPAFAESDNEAMSEPSRPASGSAVGRIVSSRWLVVAILLASVLVTLTFWRILPDSFRLNEQSDYPSYYKPVAQSILAGRGVSRGDENPATAYPPGYSLFLAGV